MVTTYITGTMNSLISTLVKRLKQPSPGSPVTNDKMRGFIPFSTPVLQATMLLIYLFGAFMNGLIAFTQPSLVLLLPGMALIIVVVRAVSHALQQRR
ncbi:hypothetical protein [Ktedonospora formicarum]|uniref:Uncharacterized protein n=1 Tax=Ktedonospora formicarum TaxID=2778364 RepID=A0A8J3MX18_9CHLR|nr:hypothetical protein [Ktedonospora formicarum]GHO50965.1 hypothetical protein KSX_91280 [Ktedonospora formicarum]